SLAIQLIAAGAKRTHPCDENVFSASPTMTGNDARTIPWSSTTARRSARRITISHRVEPADPTPAGTQPVAPFGRVGRRTRSHCPPLAPVAVSTTGKVIRDRVSGVQRGATPTARAPAAGAARTAVGRSRIKSVVTPAVLPRGRDVATDDAETG